MSITYLTPSTLTNWPGSTVSTPHASSPITSAGEAANSSRKK